MVVFKALFGRISCVALLCGRLAVMLHARLVTYARLSMHRLPSCWGTRNRSVDACSAVPHTGWRAMGSAAQRVQARTGSLSKFVAVRAVRFVKIVSARTVRFTQVFINQTRSAPRCVQAVRRMPDDRFLVPQYEGVGHTPHRPQPTYCEQNLSKATDNPKRVS
jgi:hypothetical protein